MGTMEEVAAMVQNLSNNLTAMHNQFTQRLDQADVTARQATDASTKAITEINHKMQKAEEVAKAARELPAARNLPEFPDDEDYKGKGKGSDSVFDNDLKAKEGTWAAAANNRSQNSDPLP